MERRRIAVLSLILIALVGLYVVAPSRQSDPVKTVVEHTAEKMQTPPPVAKPAPPLAKVATPAPKPVRKASSSANQGGPEQAISKLRAALAADPSNPQLMASLGATLSKSGSPEEGIPYLEQSLKIDSSDGNVFYDLVGAYLDSGHGDRGTTFLDDLIRQDIPNAGAAYTALADLRASTGDPRGGIEAALSAVNADPGSSVARSLLASMYLQTGDPRATEAFIAGEQVLTKRIAEKQSQGVPFDTDEVELLGMREGLFESLIRDGLYDQAAELWGSFPEGDRKNQQGIRLSEARGTRR